MVRERWVRTLARLPQRCIEHQRRVFGREPSKKIKAQSSAPHCRIRSTPFAKEGDGIAGDRRERLPNGHVLPAGGATGESRHDVGTCRRLVDDVDVFRLGASL